jgi:hypothetical protein
LFSQLQQGKEILDRFPNPGHYGEISEQRKSWRDFPSVISEQKPISSIIIVVVPVTLIYCTCAHGKVNEWSNIKMFMFSKRLKHFLKLHCKKTLSLTYHKN